MTSVASFDAAIETTPPVASRAELSRVLRRICADIGAERYMIVEPSVERGPRAVRILASNWVFDALEDFGTEGIARILESGMSVPAGAAPRALRVSSAGFLTAEDKRALGDNGHAEFYCQRLITGDGLAFALFSSASPSRIDHFALARAHMTCCYALEQYYRASGLRASRDPLSDRERECLLWVSEGKTTDEVALILGVSSNTVNSYVAHAIQKFGATNRAMAIATAIRSGII